MRFLLSAFLTLAACGFNGHGATPVANRSEGIAVALSAMYNSQFDVSRQLLSAYSAVHPTDPLAYSLCAASYLMSGLDRNGVLGRDFLKKDAIFANSPAIRIDPAVTAALNKSAFEARRYAQSALAVNSRDANALLALCIVSGVQRDYLALIEHKWRESYEYLKESRDYSARLLDIDPTAYDAYLSKGFTEYLVAALPFYLRWPMKLDNVSGTKQQGLDDLAVAAHSGEYLKPFAQLLLALFYLRENRRAETKQLLEQLAHDYPENAAFRQELHTLRCARSGN